MIENIFDPIFFRHLKKNIQALHKIAKLEAAGGDWRR